MILDLFAGPGGWDQGLAELGRRDVLGLEVDPIVAETRYAAGHATWVVDVSTVDPLIFDELDVEGIVASPPCQGVSTAGSQAGLRDFKRLRASIIACCNGWRDPGDEGWHDRRSKLILEPLRFVDALQPDWVALEQVPTVEPLWQTYTVALAALGYDGWCRVLNAADYGVPQLRKRAIVAARRGARSAIPRPTHRGRHVSMSDALGWGMTERPYPVIASGRTSGGGPDREKVGGSGAREAIYREQKRGAWVVNTGRFWKEGGSRADAQQFAADAQQFAADAQPAPTVDGKGRWIVSHLDDEPVNLSLDDAARLQTFPSGYPFAGGVSKQFEQVGNAIPPLLARAILEPIIGAAA